MHQSPTTDTIAAIATPSGKGGIGIIRISGPDAFSSAAKIIGKPCEPGKIQYAKFRDADRQQIDEGLVLSFRAPHSFTGEDVVELQGHGGPVVMDLLLKTVLDLNIRIARAGEFSERAFLNNRIDLAQAEAIADLIDATSAESALAAQKSLQGEFSQRVHHLVGALTRLRMYVEAAIDFPEEEIDFLSDQTVLNQIADLQNDVQSLLDSTQQGQLIRDGMTVVLTGQPNVGKSSLLNYLAGADAAIVTQVPGTTRDVLVQTIHIDGMPVQIVDTAGLRDSDDAVEQEGIRRAWRQIEHADQILLLLDQTQLDDIQADENKDSVENASFEDEFIEDEFIEDTLAAADQDLLVKLPEHIPLTLIHNKIDLIGHKPKVIQSTTTGTERTHIYLSAKTGAGVEHLRETLKQVVGFRGAESGMYLARRRHLDAVRRAQQSILHGKTQLLENNAGELLAEDLRLAQQALGEITGEVSSDDLLGKIFSSFCIGK